MLIATFITHRPFFDGLIFWSLPDLKNCMNLWVKANAMWKVCDLPKAAPPLARLRLLILSEQVAQEDQLFCFLSVHYFLSQNLSSIYSVFFFYLCWGGKTPSSIYLLMNLCVYSSRFLDRFFSVKLPFSSCTKLSIWCYYGTWKAFSIGTIVNKICSASL